jgi:plasmid stability protein
MHNDAELAMAGKKKPTPNAAITLRNLPAPVARAVREHAARYHISLNKAVIQLLEGALGGAPRPRRDDLARLAGSWSAQTARHAERKLAELRTIDEADWR